MSGLDEKDLVNLKTKELNKKLREKAISKEDVKVLKKKRRTRLNRGNLYID